MIDFSAFEVLSFDCYGTLVDWESGILDTVRSFAKRTGVEIGDARILKLYAQLESKAEAGEWVPYREVLSRVMRGFAREFHVSLAAGDTELLAGALPEWPLFPDTIAALKRLAGVFRLAVISNVDDDLFEKTRSRLGVEFDWIVTAERARSYKPSRRNFKVAMQTAGVPAARWLHAAQSLFHDVAPARELGLTTIWVNRRRGKDGAGATPPAAASAHLEVGSLAELADLAAARVK
jgi:2-haloacid dehalogenase